MKVKELKELLDKFDDELEVLIQKDEEGNGYCLVQGLDVGGVERLSYNIEEVKVLELTKDMKRKGFTEEDVAGEDWVKVLVIYP